ncbi:MAG TPA: acyl-CoA dehydratase activase [Myxococcota bacterium]|nr:acyl-CoA dehydratase activase [Myxococcota bacterium]
MSRKGHRIGIDIGALFLKAVRIDNLDNPAETFYSQHYGDPARTLEEALSRLQASAEDSIGITGSAAGLLADTLGVELLDITRCQIEAVGRRVPEARNIIDVGGGSVTLVQLDESGKFQGYSTNSLCAAGTGSFLDEQAGRMSVSYEEQKEFEHTDQPPSIAARCAVFAKTDLIHRQQEGYTKAEMWSGLCQGMTRTLFATLLNGKPLQSPTAVIGGVAQNEEVLRWMRATYPELIRVPPVPHLSAAIGAALLAMPPAHPVARPIPIQQAHLEEKGNHDWPLSLEKSNYPSFDAQEFYVDADGNEIRVLAWPAGGKVRGWLGIDIGSTSTKLALVDEQDRIVIDIYRKTGGNPIEATKLLFRAMLTLGEKKDVSFEIMGVGTTGSGRKMVGKVIGADAIINEISAHVSGATRVDPTVDTIFEIGGQDSKYMHVVDGHIRDANMNYVCAAGTGSFVEEQAKKLGYEIEKIGPAVLGIKPPRTSDRCTVFMEQDVAKLVRSGVSPEEAMAGVMVSIVKNYLNKVVGNRHRSSKKIFFQGATARNQGLVAAFERLMGCEIVVSPYCHVMGSYGVAMLTRAAMAEQAISESSFAGLDLDRRAITIRKETCKLCQNHCSISFADIEGIEESPSWGFMCGRDPDEDKVRVNPRDKPFRVRTRLWREGGSGVPVPDDAPVVGIPQSLTTYTYLPLWRRFFNCLGYKILLSGVTNAKIRALSSKLAGAEFCFPAKVGIGHAASLATREGVDFIFVPHMVSETQNQQSTAAKFCPYVQAAPAYSRTALDLNGQDSSRVLSPVVDMRLSESRLVDLLARNLTGPLGRTVKEIHAAFRDALVCQRGFEKNCRQEGRKVIAEAAAKGEKIVVLAGRPYNSYDSDINLGLPQKLAEHGRTVLPMDFLDLDPNLLGERYRNTYWNYGQKILATLRRVARDDNLDVVYLTNFNCGPDSFLLTYAEEIMGDKPFLALELDEHGADAGYMTRIEAFFDVLRRPRSRPSSPPQFRPEPTDLKDRTIWVPPMHPLGTALVAAAFRGHGFRAQALPPENKESFELGRTLTRGSECLPTSLTIGAFIKMIRTQEHSGRHAFFMPTAEGPCRFGQYCSLHRQILDRQGLEDVAILSPSSYNSYQGLDEPVRRSIWKAFLVADVLYKAACKVRPYEVHPGKTDQVVARQLAMLESVMERGRDLYAAVAAAVGRVAAVETSGSPKPLVGVVGEIYVRCNEFANESVVRSIERFGGEAWLAPMSEWILYTAATQSISFRDRSRNFLKKWISDLKNIYIFHVEHKMYAAAGPFLADRHEPDIRDVVDSGSRYLPIQFEGEALITVGRAIKFADQGAAMVVNCAPFGCMPGTLTTALFRKLAPELGIPVVGMFYDGAGNQNERLRIFLNNAVQKKPTPARYQERHKQIRAKSSARPSA